MDLLYIWHGYRYCFKILFDTIPTPAYDLEAKVTDLEIYDEVSKSLYAFTLHLA